MGPNRRAQERERAAARAAAEAKRAEAERKAIVDAQKVCRSKENPLSWSPPLFSGVVTPFS
jgi:hypothetical protein